LPSDAEWNRLINFLGGASIAGYKMKSAWSWKDGGNGNNASGFNGLPGGYRSGNQAFYRIGFNGYWWASTENNLYSGFYRYLYYGEGNVYRDSFDKEIGLSVRCVRD
jgi:uncharacterized protein (TIGR02145 family)